MLESLVRKKNSHLPTFILIGVLFILSSCLPSTSRPSLNEASVNNPDQDLSNKYPPPNFPVSGVFIQEGATQSAANFLLPLNFNDSFLLRGKPLHDYLLSLPESVRMCVVFKFNHIPSADRFLLLAARTRSYINLFTQTKEFYLQIEPANQVANQLECFSYNLTNSLFLNAQNPSAHFDLNSLCSNCSSNVLSEGMLLHFTSGERVPSIQTSSIRLNISGGNNFPGNTCLESTSCKAKGMDCCLFGECVKDKAERPGASTLPGYATAIEDVKLNPERYILYPQFFYVCGSKPDGGSSSGPNPVDPDYEALVRLMELKHLYDCLNQVEEEFSFCTLKFIQANKNIPGIFPLNQNFKDDINFQTSNTNLTGSNNITKIIYGGTVIFEDGVSIRPGVNLNSPNNDLNFSQTVDLSLNLPTEAKDANLYVTYKVDGTCESINSTLTKCKKSFIYGSSNTKSTMWHPGGNNKIFSLPPYADTGINANLIVKVNGITIPEDLTQSTNWHRFGTSKQIRFTNSFNLYQNQLIEVTYFVVNQAQELVKLKTLAQNEVNKICLCGTGGKCNLKPVINESTKAITNYECIYSTPTDSEPPVNQTVYVSNKNIPQRFFDLAGVSYDENFQGEQERNLLAPTTEAPAFTYLSNNTLRPNNISQYVGFSEIYGSLQPANSGAAKPAKLVKVKKDRVYDILVNSGVFSSCLNCGVDYYSNLQQLFPQNFSAQGGGYVPDLYETRRQNSSSLYRSDDLLFGRACFVPATMIPWTHVPANLARDQRRSRLSAAHFLFANGYQRDWYGFDYGSVIGSFDGVSWFSIGSSRRIRAKTNKLFLAVNAYLGDLNSENNFNVTVAESNSFSSTIADHDSLTNGAQCQRSHFCSQDNDCFRQLGYDYSCQNVASLFTPWPEFDSQANEIPGTSATRSLLSIIGGANGQTKRCVYRGRGSPCLENLTQTQNSFNGSSSIGTLQCSPNNSCLPLTQSLKFNDRIARFAAPPATQNADSGIPTKSDTVGLGARIILRPFEYYGTKSVPALAKSTLESNQVQSICVPGRDVSQAQSTFDLHTRHPVNRIDSSDKLYGTGPVSASSLSAQALNSCPATDAAGISLQTYDLPISDPILSMFSISQNISSNLLSPLTGMNIYSSTGTGLVTSIGYQRNTCLRAPGASCFSDLECAPSSIVANKARSASANTYPNQAEKKFWEEELVCGNPDFKNLAPGVLNPVFDLKKNKCCREFGKSLTVYTQKNNSDFEWCDDTTSEIKIAGINKSITSSNRYTRIQSVYDKMTCNRTEISTTKSFALSLSAPNSTARFTQIQRQYQTLDALNQRTCCSSHWVRNFATENGGGHQFSSNKMQNIDKIMFRNISWLPDNTSWQPSDPDSAFECGVDDFSNGSCEIKNLTPTEEKKYLDWAVTLELMGIPQVAISTNDEIFQLVDDNQQAAALFTPLKDSVGPLVIGSNSSNADFIDPLSKRYYSAANSTGMNLGSNSLKKVFSEENFNCCLPSGQEVPAATSSIQCCTGNAQTISGIRRCCLPNFTNLSVYLNRYVSSEGRGLPETAYDPATGFIKDAGMVELLAAQKNLCCSGNFMTGVAISELPIPLTGGTYRPNEQSARTRRFTYRSDEVDNNPETGFIGSIFDQGVRWNNHVYCVPAGFGQ